MGFSLALDSIPVGWMWCPETESNRHVRLRTRDFKSRASASFAIRARLLTSSENKTHCTFWRIPFLNKVAENTVDERRTSASRLEFLDAAECW